MLFRWKYALSHYMILTTLFKSSLYGTISLDCTHFKMESGRKMSIAVTSAEIKRIEP